MTTNKDMSYTDFDRYLKKHDSQKAHALLSASGSERWLGCPGSANLCKDIPEQRNEYSVRGTHTHTLLQFILENPRWQMLLFKTLSGGHFLRSIGYDKEMLNAALFAAKYVWGLLENGMTLYTEQKVELEGVGFGTSDVILHKPFGPLHVIDFKNGTKTVEVVGNTQGLYYAYAAADLFNWEMSKIIITIVQPNASHIKGQIRSWEVDYETLIASGIRFRKGAAASRRLDAPLVKNDSWCWWCPARPKCPAHMSVREAKLMELFNQ